jgi:hypothetical protein
VIVRGALARAPARLCRLGRQASTSSRSTSSTSCAWSLVQRQLHPLPDRVTRCARTRCYGCPPQPALSGGVRIARFFLETVAQGDLTRIRHRPTSANGRPAVTIEVRAEDGTRIPHGRNASVDGDPRGCPGSLIPRAMYRAKRLRPASYAKMVTSGVTTGARAPVNIPHMPMRECARRRIREYAAAARASYGDQQRPTLSVRGSPA